MEIIEKNGDLLNEKCDIICHQVNCQGVMGSGIALQIKNKWPKVFREYYEYVNMIKEWKDGGVPLLGRCSLVNIKDCSDNIEWVANIFGQYFYGTDRRHTDYIAFEKCLLFIRDFVYEEYGYYGKQCVIGFPYKIGCDRGGGEWNIVYDLIKKTFEKENVIIKIVKYDK